METKKEDRRIRRTKRLLKQGLALMMAEKSFNDITVKDITDKVDLNRSTFYLHYTDTYDLLEKLENDTLDDFQNMIEANTVDENNISLKTVIGAIIDYILENPEICRLIFENKASGDFFVKFKELFERNGISTIKNKYPHASQEKIDYYFSFITYGAIGFLKKWFSDDMALKKAEVVDFADGIIDCAAACLKE